MQQKRRRGQRSAAPAPSLLTEARHVRVGLAPFCRWGREGTEGQVACPRSHSEEVTESGFNPGTRARALHGEAPPAPQRPPRAASHPPVHSRWASSSRASAAEVSGHDRGKRTERIPTGRGALTEGKSLFRQHSTQSMTSGSFRAAAAPGLRPWVLWLAAETFPCVLGM